MKARTADRYPGIYCIYNKLNGKKYIGKAKNIYLRIKDHVTRLNTKSTDENPHLINSWHKHGRDNFDYDIVEKLPFQPDLIAERELYWQSYYCTTDKSKGYNLRMDSSTGMICHPDTRQKMSDAHRIRMSTPEMKKKTSEQFKAYWKANPDRLKEVAQMIRELVTKYSIVQMTRNMEIVKEYKGRNDILENYPELYLQAILAVCNGSKASYKGYYWRYRELATGKIVEQRERRTRTIPVVMLCTYTNDFIQEFPSAMQAGKFIGQTQGGNITMECRRKTKIKSRKVYFRYKSDYEKGSI